MFYFAEIACVVFEMLLIHLFQRSFFETRFLSNWVVWLSYAVFGGVVACLSLTPIAFLLRIAISLLGVSLLTWLLFDTSALYAFFASLVFNALYVLNDVLGLSILMLARVDSTELLAHNGTRALYLVITHLTFFAIIVFVCLWGKGRYSLFSSRTILLLSPCWMSSVLLCCLLISNVYFMDLVLHPLYIFVSLGLLYMNVLLIWIIGKMERQEQEQKASELALYHYNLQSSYYEQLYSQQNDIRALWHDIHKYIHAAQIEWGTTRSSEELQQLREKLDNIINVIDVHNRVLNIILNEYIHIAKSTGICLDLDVQVAPELAITISDLYIILGNTLDNALAACKELPEAQRVIHLKLYQQQQVLYYQLDNPFLPAHPQRPRDKNHGFGLKNVKQRVEKYEGHCEIRQANGIFTFLAHINCPTCQVAPTVSAQVTL